MIGATARARLPQIAEPIKCTVAVTPKSLWDALMNSKIISDIPAPDRRAAAFKISNNPLLIGFRKIQPSLVALPQDDLDTEVAGKLRDKLVVVANLRELLRLTRCEFVLFTLSVDRNEEVLSPSA